MTKEMTEAQKVGLVRNALLIAGYEMGQDGDHWPVINATIHSIAKDWEDTKIEENVDAELKIHLYEQLAIMEAELPKCSEAARADLAPKLKELRDIYDAYFSSLDQKAVVIMDDDEIPDHVKRADAIISTL